MLLWRLQVEGDGAVMTPPSRPPTVKQLSSGRQIDKVGPCLPAILEDSTNLPVPVQCSRHAVQVVNLSVLWTTRTCSCSVGFVFVCTLPLNQARSGRGLGAGRGRGRGGS